MNGLEWVHLEDIKEEEEDIYEVAGKNAHWSVSDGGLMTSLICGRRSQSHVTPNHFR